MKNCELCKTKATTFCESDQASLCWGCDAKVHGANFLVARHSRTLLCHSCQCPTPWKASGAKLGNTYSFCENCKVSLRGEESQTGYEDDVGTDEDVNDDEYSTDSDLYSSDVMSDNGGADDYGDEVIDDKQVVRLSTSSTPPPPASSSSSDESVSSYRDMDGDFAESVAVLPSKRMRENTSDLHLQKDDQRSSSGCNSMHIHEVVADSRSDVEAACHESCRRLKSRRTGSGRSI